MTARNLVDRYAEKLEWSNEDRADALISFVDELGLTAELHDYLTSATGVELDDDGAVGYQGRPFAVLAYAAGSKPHDPPLERVDVESEILAMEAFSVLLRREDVERLTVVQFNPETHSRRNLLAYDRLASSGTWQG